MDAAHTTTTRGRLGIARRLLSRRTAGTLVLIAFAVAWYGLFAPSLVGGSTSYVIVSGNSMEPSLSTGDLVVARQLAEYRTGDVVAFRIPRGHVGEGEIVIHRIIGGSAQLGYPV